MVIFLNVFYIWRVVISRCCTLIITVFCKCASHDIYVKTAYIPHKSALTVRVAVLITIWYTVFTFFSNVLVTDSKLYRTHLPLEFTYFSFYISSISSHIGMCCPQIQWKSRNIPATFTSIICLDHLKSATRMIDTLEIRIAQTHRFKSVQKECHWKMIGHIS